MKKELISVYTNNIIGLSTLNAAPISIPFIQTLPSICSFPPPPHGIQTTLCFAPQANSINVYVSSFFLYTKPHRREKKGGSDLRGPRERQCKPPTHPPTHPTNAAEREKLVKRRVVASRYASKEKER
jgi:hypothetical protein